MWVAFANAKVTHIFFSKNISVCAIFNDQNFNNTLTNDIVGFKQLGPDELQCEKKALLSFHRINLSNCIPCSLVKPR